MQPWSYFPSVGSLHLGWAGLVRIRFLCLGPRHHVGGKLHPVTTTTTITITTTSTTTNTTATKNGKYLAGGHVVLGETIQINIQIVLV